METCVKRAREEYQNWYQNQAGRAKVYFEPEQPETAQGLPLPERMRRVRQGGEDTGLWNLYLGFARHLLIGSSQKGGFPSNLQGIWSEEIQPPLERRLASERAAAAVLAGREDRAAGEP